MEGPEIEGPPIWLNLNRQAEEKLLGFCKNNNARLQWLDDYLAEAKAKLGVKCEEPTFVPKTPGKSKTKPKRGGRRTKAEAIDTDVTVVNVDTPPPNVAAAELETTTTAAAPAAATRASRRTTRAAQDTSTLEPVPKPRSSKRTRNAPNSASSESSVLSAEEGPEGEPTAKKSPPVPEEARKYEPPEAISTTPVNSTVIVENVDNVEGDKTVTEENVFIEAEVVRPVETVRNLLKSVTDLPSPIPAPRRSFRNIAETEAAAETAVEILSKTVEVSDEAGEDNKIEVDAEMEVPEEVPDEENDKIETEEDIPESNENQSIEKHDNEDKNNEVNNETRTLDTSSMSRTEKQDHGISESEDVLPINSSQDSAASQSPDKSTEEQIPTRTITEPLIIAAKEPQGGEDEDDASTTRSTRTKTKQAATATDEVVLAQEPVTGGEEKSTRRTRTKVASGKESQSSEEDSSTRRTTRSKVKEAAVVASSEDEASSRSRRTTRTKVKEVAAVPSSEDESSGRRVTRSKVREVAQEPVRSTRTFSKNAASASQLTKAAASPRVRELAAQVMSPSKAATPPRKAAAGFSGSPIRDRVRAFENAMKESAGLKSSSSEEEEVAPPKTPSRQFFTPKRKSSIANSLRKVSAARNVSVAKVVEEQEVNVVSPPRKGPVIRKSPGNKPKVNLNNSRAPTGKVIKAGGKKVAASGGRVAASGGRGVTPQSGGSSTGSSSLVRSRSRMDIIQRAGKTTPSGNGPSNLRVGATSFLAQKPKGPTLEEIQAKKEEERRQKQEREAAAKQRREEQMKNKAEEAKRQREERIQRVKEAREKQENKKEKAIAKKIDEKETQDKLAVLKKKEEVHKENERKKKETEEKSKREEAEKIAKIEEEKREKEELLRVQEEKKKEKERMRQVLQKKEDERRAALEKQRIQREQEELRKMKEREVARGEADHNSTYSKPADATFNRTQTMDQSYAGPQSYDLTPARCDLPPPPPQTEDDYGLEDLNSGTDTDDEDNPKKQVPKWAEGTQLRTALLKQCYMGPDVDNIFFTIEDPDLTVMFNQEHRRYNKRTSSACWDAAPQSFNFKRV